MMPWTGARWNGLQALLAAVGVAILPGVAAPVITRASHHKTPHKRRDKRCKGNRKTCDRGRDILDGNSQDFCKQSCRVALSRCKTNC